MTSSLIFIWWYCVATNCRVAGLVAVVLRCVATNCRVARLPCCLQTVCSRVFPYADVCSSMLTYAVALLPEKHQSILSLRAPDQSFVRYVTHMNRYLTQS